MRQSRYVFQNYFQSVDVDDDFYNIILTPECSQTDTRMAIFFTLARLRGRITSHFSL